MYYNLGNASTGHLQSGRSAKMADPPQGQFNPLANGVHLPAQSLSMLQTMALISLSVTSAHFSRCGPCPMTLKSAGAQRDLSKSALHPNQVDEIRVFCIFDVLRHIGLELLFGCLAVLYAGLQSTCGIDLGRLPGRGYWYWTNAFLYVRSMQRFSDRSWSMLSVSCSTILGSSPRDVPQ